MRLREIRIQKLFGLFDHVIPLNMDERITIMHGPNGFGKTAILRMIDAVFRRSYGALRELPFEFLDLEFADGQTLSVRKGQQRTQSNDEGTRLAFQYGRHQPFSVQSVATRLFHESGMPLRLLEQYVPDLERVGPSVWRHKPSGELLDLDGVLERFSDSLPFLHIMQYEHEEAPSWLTQLTDSLNVHLIRANRLERTERIMRRGEPGIELTFVVEKFARELAELIQATLAQYAELSQSLDRSFPRRLVTTAPDPSTSLPNSRIREKLTEIEEKRRRLTDAGLIDKEEQSHFEIPPGTGIESEKIDVLSVYIADVEKKLGVFDDLFRKIERHGVDFRNPLNQTPLMLAVQLGLDGLAVQLIERGAKGIKFIGPMHSYGADVYSGREPRRGLGRQAVFRLGRQLLHPGQPPIHGLHRLL